MAQLFGAISSQTWQYAEGFLQNPVHLVVDNVTSGPEVNRVDNLVVPVLLVTVKVFGLSTMA